MVIIVQGQRYLSLKFLLRLERFRAETGVFTKNAGTERSNRVRFHIFKRGPIRMA